MESSYIHTYIHTYIRLKPSSFRKVDFDAIHRQLQATWVRSPEDSAGRSARGRSSGQATHLLMFAIMLYIVFTVCMYVFYLSEFFFRYTIRLSFPSMYVCMGYTGDYFFSTRLDNWRSPCMYVCMYGRTLHCSGCCGPMWSAPHCWKTRSGCCTSCMAATVAMVVVTAIHTQLETRREKLQRQGQVTLKFKYMYYKVFIWCQFALPSI